MQGFIGEVDSWFEMISMYCSYKIRFDLSSRLWIKRKKLNISNKLVEINFHPFQQFFFINYSLNDMHISPFSQIWNTQINSRSVKVITRDNLKFVFEEAMLMLKIQGRPAAVALKWADEWFEAAFWSGGAGANLFGAPLWTSLFDVNLAFQPRALRGGVITARGGRKIQVNPVNS